MQTFGNELVNLKKQQFQPKQPLPAQNFAANQGYQQQNQGYQQHNQGQSQNRRNFQGYNTRNKQNINQRLYRPYNPAPLNVANLVKDVVPVAMQNNMVTEYEWCFPCNQPHSQATCSNGVINQALMVQNATSMQHALEAEIEQQQDIPLVDASFLNWQGDEFCGLNGDDPKIAVYSRNKKRALDNQNVSNNNNTSNAATAG